MFILELRELIFSFRLIAPEIEIHFEANLNHLYLFMFKMLVDCMTHTCTDHVCVQNVIDCIKHTYTHRDLGDTLTIRKGPLSKY